jgi:hypothetical protein
MTYVRKQKAGQSEFGDRTIGEDLAVYQAEYSESQEDR